MARARPRPRGIVPSGLAPLAAVASLLPLAACSGGGAGADPARVEELERRVALLERRLADAPAESVSMASAEFEELARRLDAEDPLERLRAGRALGDRIAEMKLDALRLLESGTLRQREGIAIVLSTRATPDMVPGMLAAHPKAAESRVRIFLDRALGQAGAPEAADALIADLAHPDEGVRLAAVGALGKLGDPRAAAPLAKLVASGEGLAAQAAAGALARLGEPVAPYLAATWGSHGPRERRAIVQALERLRNPAVDRFLAERLEDPSPLVALEAARVLGSRGDMSGSELAMERLKSEDPAVAMAARAALDAMENAPE